MITRPKYYRSTDEIYIVAPYGLTDLFNMVLRRNPCRVTREQIYQRLHSKQILRKWPHVQVIYEEFVFMMPNFHIPIRGRIERLNGCSSKCTPII